MAEGRNNLPKIGPKGHYLVHSGVRYHAALVRRDIDSSLYCCIFQHSGGRFPMVSLQKNTNFTIS